MADEDISAKITADASDLNENLGEAADSVSAAFERLQEIVEKCGDALEKSLGEGAENAKQHLHEAEEEAGSFGETLESMKNTLQAGFEATGIFVIAEAFEKVSEAAERAMEAGTEYVNQSEVLGITVEQYQRLSEAAKEAGVSQGMVSRVAIKLRTDLAEARDGVSDAIDKLNQLGLTNWSDPMMDENKLLEELGARLRDSATAGETMAAFQKEFSSRMAMAAEVLKTYNGEDRKWYDQSTEDAERLHEMHKFWTDVGDAIAGTTAKLILWMGTKTDLTADDQGNLVGSEDKGDEEAEEKEKRKQEASDATTKNDEANSEKQKKAAVDAAQAEIQATKSGTEARVAAVEKYVEAVEAYYTRESQAYTKAQAELVKAKQEAAETDSKAAERSSEDELKAAERTLNLHEGMLRRTTEKMTKDWDEYFEQFIKKDDEMAKAAEQTVAAESASAQKILDAQLKAQQISPETWATAYIATIHNVEDAQVAMYENLKAGADGNVAVMQEMDNKIAAAHAKAAQETIEANQKETQEIQKDWEKITKPIETAFDSAIQKMVNGTQNLRQSVKSVMDSLVTDVFGHAIQQMTHQWLQGMEQQLMGTKVANQGMVASTTETAATTKTVQASTATSGIIANAAHAASGAASAVASIPYVGPVLAIAAMAAMEAAVLALIGKIASAEGGMVLDSDQLVSAHEDEMILPAHISQGIQEKILGTSGDNVAGGSSTRNTYHINANDSASFEKFLNKHSNRNAMMRALQKADRRGNRAGAR